MESLSGVGLLNNDWTFTLICTHVDDATLLEVHLHLHSGDTFVASKEHNSRRRIRAASQLRLRRCNAKTVIRVGFEQL